MDKPSTEQDIVADMITSAVNYSETIGYLDDDDVIQPPERLEYSTIVVVLVGVNGRAIRISIADVGTYNTTN